MYDDGITQYSAQSLSLAVVFFRRSPDQCLFFFKESLIAFILYRIWRWTAVPGGPGGLSLPRGPVPACVSLAINIVTSTSLQ